MKLYAWLIVLKCSVLSVNSFLVDCETDICGSPLIQPASHRIVGGQESLQGSLPWMAMLMWCDYMTCGGAIINKKFILTAAHCFDEPTYPCFKINSKETHYPSNWTVYVGKHNVLRSNEGEMQYEVDSIVIHPLYDNITHTNDIALLKLKDNITYTPLISPVCLPSPTESPQVHQSCIVAGYGSTLTLDTFSLHQVTVPILSDEKCSQPDWYGTGYFFPPEQFCAGFESGGQDACDGDSGSPLICKFDRKWYANGIVSKGLGCAQPRKPGVYSNTSHHSIWIQMTMAEHGLSPTCL